MFNMEINIIDEDIKGQHVFLEDGRNPSTGDVLWAFSIILIMEDNNNSLEIETGLFEFAEILLSIPSHKELYDYAMYGNDGQFGLKLNSEKGKLNIKGMFGEGEVRVDKEILFKTYLSEYEKTFHRYMELVPISKPTTMDNCYEVYLDLKSKLLSYIKELEMGDMEMETRNRNHN